MNGNDIMVSIAVVGVFLFMWFFLYIWYHYLIPFIFIACVVAIVVMSTPSHHEKEGAEIDRET